MPKGVGTCVGDGVHHIECNEERCRWVLNRKQRLLDRIAYRNRRAYNEKLVLKRKVADTQVIWRTVRLKYEIDWHERPPYLNVETHDVRRTSRLQIGRASCRERV